MWKWWFIKWEVTVTNKTLPAEGKELDVLFMTHSKMIKKAIYMSGGSSVSGALQPNRLNLPATWQVGYPFSSLVRGLV